MFKAEIYFVDLTDEARERLISNLATHPCVENWDITPLAVIERDVSGIEDRDRIGEWREFAEHMEAYIRDRTIDKYVVKGGRKDLMSFTTADICLWNIMKYATRMLNGKGRSMISRRSCTTASCGGRK